MRKKDEKKEYLCPICGKRYICKTHNFVYEKWHKNWVKGLNKSFTTRRENKGDINGKKGSKRHK